MTLALPISTHGLRLHRGRLAITSYNSERGVSTDLEYQVRKRIERKGVGVQDTENLTMLSLCRQRSRETRRVCRQRRSFLPRGEARLAPCFFTFLCRLLQVASGLQLNRCSRAGRRPPLAPRLLVQHEMQRCEHGVVVEERAVAKVRAVAEAACATDPRARISRRVGRAGEARGACGDVRIPAS